MGYDRRATDIQAVHQVSPGGELLRQALPADALGPLGSGRARVTKAYDIQVRADAAAADSAEATA
jgi:hypothetical protein